MKVSIITVVFNGASAIKSAIESVLSQTFKDIEYIIIDGGSKDGTVDIVRSYGNKIAKFVSEPDKGIYDAMNKGIALATGDVVGILNSDDLYESDRVLQLVADAMSNPQVHACYGDLVYVDKSNAKVVRYWKSNAYKKGMFRRGWVPAHPTFFVRRSVYQKHGVFDLRYYLAADFELMFRFMQIHKISVEYIPHVLVRMRLGGATNKSLGNVISQNLEIIKLLYNSSEGVSPLFFLNKFLERTGQFIKKQ